MEAYNIKGGIVIYYPLALFVILILNAYCCCGSPVLVESNTTNFLSNDVIGEFLTDDLCSTGAFRDSGAGAGLGNF